MSSATFAFSVRLRAEPLGRVADALVAPAREERVDQTRVRLRRVAEQLVGELAVRLREQRVGAVGHHVRELRRGRAARRARQLGRLREPVVDERGEVLARAAHRHVELARDVVGRRLPAPAQRVEHRAPAFGQRRARPRLVGHRCVVPGGAGGCRRTRATGNHPRAPRCRPARARAGPRSPRASAGGRFGLVPAGDQAVDRAHAALGRDHELGPTARRVHDAVRVGRRSRARARPWCRPRSRGRPPRAPRSRARRSRRARGSARGTASRALRATTRRACSRIGIDRDAAPHEVDHELGA